MMRTSKFCTTGMAWLAAGLLMLSGCGEKEKVYVIGTVTGRITLGDQPLKPGCVIVFHPVSGDGILGSALVGENGEYEITRGKAAGVPVGEYRITVAPPPLDEDTQEEINEKNQALILNALAKQNAAGLKESLVIPQTDIVPQLYWAEGTSPLKFTVVEGDNTKDFQLEPAAAR